MPKSTFTIVLECGHIRGSFQRKPGKNFYCTECKCLRDSLGEVTSQDEKAAT